MQEISTKPYLLRALYEWCTDNGYTPHIAVRVDQSTRVPRQFVRDGEIVLNISFDATSGLKLGNEFVEFKARFGGVPREIIVPMDRVIAIYARENGQGMRFPCLCRQSPTMAWSQPLMRSRRAPRLQPRTRSHAVASSWCPARKRQTRTGHPATIRRHPRPRASARRSSASSSGQIRRSTLLGR